MKILFTFENPLPSTAADAEVFFATAKALRRYFPDAKLLLPLTPGQKKAEIEKTFGVTITPNKVPLSPAALRHFLCGLSLGLRKEFRQADLLYTRNLWIAWISTFLGKPTIYDHFRPWAEQIPPLLPFILQLLRRRSFLFYACHSDYLKKKYIKLGAPPEKLFVVHNGFDPERFANLPSKEEARLLLDIPSGRPVILYSGRINHKKGLEVVLEAAKKLPNHLFLLVGQEKENPITRKAAEIENIVLRPWETDDKKLATYLQAADILLIPPSLQPLAVAGATVLPLKTYLYLGSGKVIVAGKSPDILEILQDGENAKLVPTDDPQALAACLQALTSNPEEMARVSKNALACAHSLTWEMRAKNLHALLWRKLSSSASAPLTAHPVPWKTIFSRTCKWILSLCRGKGYILPDPDLTEKK